MADKEDVGIWALIAVFGVSLLLVGSLLIFVLSYIIDRALLTTDTFGSATRIVSITINAALTIALIFIYRDIRTAESKQENWMEQQTEILDEQQNLSKAQMTPLLSVAFPEDEIPGDEIRIVCTNTGTGIARELDIELELFVSEKGGSQMQSIEGQKLTPLSDIGRSIEVEVHGAGKGGQTVPGAEGFWGRAGALRRTDYDGENRTHAEPVVKPDTEVEFKCNLEVMYYGGPVADPGDASPISFKKATEKLSEMDYETIGYRLLYSYEDLIGERQKTSIFSSGFAELSSGMDFSEVATNSIGGIGRFESPPRYGGERYIARIRY